MALTQARAAGPFAGRRYGSFADRGSGSHPVDELTHGRAFGALTGARYGSFAGRDGSADHPVGELTHGRAFGAFTGARYSSFAGRGDAGAHPVVKITQGRAFGALTGKRYGSFAGRAGSDHPVGRLTQLRAFGPHTGRRYGLFEGREEAEPPEPEEEGSGGGGILPDQGRKPRGQEARPVKPIEYAKPVARDLREVLETPAPVERIAPIAQPAPAVPLAVLANRIYASAAAELKAGKTQQAAIETAMKGADVQRLEQRDRNRLRAAVLSALLLMQ